MHLENKIYHISDNNYMYNKTKPTEILITFTSNAVKHTPFFVLRVSEIS